MYKSRRPGTLFPLFLFLIALVLVGLFSSASDYYDYTSGAIENTASISPLNKESILAGRAAPVSYDTEVKYRKFFITVPGAQRVELLADFNRWGKDPVVLKAYRKGYFETSGALAAGEYKYVFSVDGKDVLDPLNKDRQSIGGREVCIKTVR